MCLCQLLAFMLNAARLVRVITMALGNITCIIAAACVTYLPTEQKWNRLVAYWFTQFQVCHMSLRLPNKVHPETHRSAQSVGFSLSLVMVSNNVSRGWGSMVRN